MLSVVVLNVGMLNVVAPLLNVLKPLYHNLVLENTIFRTDIR
jgi:hypothetical protein